MVYRPGGNQAQQRLVWVDRQGHETAIAGPSLLLAGELALSPDGSTLLTAAGDTNHFLWMIDLARGAATRLTQDFHSHAPTWTPDGKRILFNGNRFGEVQTIRSLSLDRPDRMERLTSDSRPEFAPQVSRDGRTVEYGAGAPNNLDIYAVSLDAPGNPKPLLASRSNEAAPVLSPDQRWLAYTSNESGRFEVYVRPYPDLGRALTVSTGGGAEPLWSRDGRELFYRWNGEIFAVPFDSARGAVATPVKVLSGYPQLNAFRGYDVGPDGRFIIAKQTPETDTVFHIVLGWERELARLTGQTGTRVVPTVVSARDPLAHPFSGSAGAFCATWPVAFAGEARTAETGNVDGLLG
jgi:serine/threonine-protein kinase